MTSESNKKSIEELALFDAKTSLTRKEEQIKELERRLKELEVENREESALIRDRGDFRNGYFTFCESVSPSSVDYLLQNVRRFSRLFPGQPITIEFNSGGGHIIEGFRLFDELKRIKFDGNHVLTIKARGNIASMAVPIFQAADVREVGESCWVMIHRAAFGAIGKAYDIEDQADFVRRLEGRIIDILAERSSKPREYFVDILDQRKDVWFSAAEAVELGLADAIG